MARTYVKRPERSRPRQKKRFHPALFGERVTADYVFEYEHQGVSQTLSGASASDPFAATAGSLSIAGAPQALRGSLVSDPFTAGAGRLVEPEALPLPVAIQRLTLYDQVQGFGGRALRDAVHIVSAKETRELNGPETAEYGVPRTEAIYSLAREGMVLQRLRGDGDIAEWRIAKVSDGARDGVLQGLFKCESILNDLGRRAGFVHRTEVDGTVDLDFNAGELPLDDWFDVAQATPQFPAYVGKGTIELNRRVPLNPDGETPLSLFREATRLAGGDMELIRLPGAGGFRLDFRSERGSDAEIAWLTYGHNLVELERDQDVFDQATSVWPRGGGDQGRRATIARHRWRVGSIAGQAVSLSDPSGTVQPIRFDGQLAGPNLLGEDAEPEKSQDPPSVGTWGIYRNRVPIEHLGLAVGDVVSLGAELRGNGTDDVDIRIIWRDVADAIVRQDAVPSVSVDEWRRSVIEALTIPSGTTTVTVVNRTNGAGGSGALRVRRAILVAGATAVPFVDSARFLEKPDGTLTEVLWSEAATNRVWLASVSNLSPGDLVTFRLNSSGHELAFLERPDSVAAWGRVTGLLDRRDLPPVDNELANGFFSKFSGNDPDSWQKSGSPVVTQSTIGNRHKHGTSSAKVEASQDGDGLFQDVTIEPTDTERHYALQVHLTISSGAVRVRLEDLTNGGVWPVIGSPQAKSSTRNRWLTFNLVGRDLRATETTQVRVRIEADGGPATYFLDAAQLVRTPDRPKAFVEGRIANEMWRAALDDLETRGPAAQRFQLLTVDFQRLQPGQFTYDQLVLGGTVKVRHDILGINFQTRIVWIEQDLVDPGKTRLKLSQNPRDFVRMVSGRGRRAPADPSPGSAAPADADARPPVGADDVQFQDGQTAQGLQPAQPGADVTAENTAANTVSVGSRTSSEVEDASNRVFNALTNVGDLSGNILIEDGTNTVRIAKGKQGGQAADGEPVVFSPAFQDVPTIFFRPTGVYWIDDFVGAGAGDPWDGAGDLDVGSTDAGPHTEIHTIDSVSPTGVYVISGTITVTGPGSGSSAGQLTAEVDVDGDGTWSPFGESLAIDATRLRTDEEFRLAVNPVHVRPGVSKLRLKLERTASSGSWELTVSPQSFLDNPTGGPAGELFWKTVPDGLSASGFTPVAKIVERNITVSETVEAFGAGTLTSEGASLALGGLSADAVDDEYRVLYDGSLTVDSQDNLQTVTDGYPAGPLTAAGESKTRELSGEANDDSYTSQYDGTVSAKASGATATSEPMSGTLTTGGATSPSATLSRNPSGSFTTFVDIPSNSGGVTVAVDLDTGGGFVEQVQKTFGAGTVDLQSIGWSSGAAAKNDAVRVRIVSGSGFQVNPQQTNYDAFFRRVEYVVVTEVNKGSGWTQKGTSTHVALDEDGTQNTTTITNQQHDFTDAGLSQGHQVRLRIASRTTQGAAAADESASSIDPEHVSYQQGSAETATLQLTVAIDAKDGAGAWIEKATLTHQVTDTTGTGTTKNLTDEVQSFVDSLIATGDNVRVRVKAAVVTGLADSHSFSIDPQDVRYNEASGTITEHTQTPQPGDVIPWVALTS